MNTTKRRTSDTRGIMIENASRLPEWIESPELMLPLSKGEPRHTPGVKQHGSEVFDTWAQSSHKSPFRRVLPYFSKFEISE